jgi:hypothetical protein
MNKKTVFLFLLIIFMAKGLCASELKTNLKSKVQQAFLSITEKQPLTNFKSYNGIELIEGEGYRGLKLTVGYVEIKIDTWTEDVGLLERFKQKVAEEENEKLVASINGTFYSSRGILGQVIVDGSVPKWPKQFVAALPRAFLSSFRGLKGYQHWFLGETTVDAWVLKSNIYDKVWFNGESSTGTMMDNFIGGGGWILRARRDVHKEALDRQRFRFRDEDLRSRKTVVAQDTERALYLLVFEVGSSLHQVARTFVKDERFSGVQEAIFLDGGASSCIVINGEYFVPPLYIVDKARFSAIDIYKTDATW